MRHTFCLPAGRVTLRSLPPADLPAAAADPCNAPVLALLARAGRRCEGHFRESGHYQGEWCAEVHFAVLAREWLG